MRKHIYIYSIVSLLILPPLWPSAGSFRHRMPDMSKGFKKSKSVFDTATREACDKKVKEPLGSKKVEHNGPYLGQALGLVWDAIVMYATSKTIEKIVSAPTHPIQTSKEEGGIKGAVASAVEEAVVVGVPLGLGAASIKAAEAGVELGTYMAGRGAVASTSGAMPWSQTVAATSPYCPAPLTGPVASKFMTNEQIATTGVLTPLAVKHSMAYYPPPQQAAITQNMQHAVTSAPGITGAEAAGMFVGVAAVEQSKVFNFSSKIRGMFVKIGESIAWLP